MKNNKIIKVLSLVLVIIFMFTTMGQGIVSAYEGQEESNLSDTGLHLQLPPLEEILHSWQFGQTYQLAEGFEGMIVSSNKGQIYLFAFRPGSGMLSSYIYKDDHWVLTEVINTIKGFEKPMAVKRYKYSIWNDYSGSNNMGDNWGTKKVTNGSLEIELSGPKKTSVNKQETYTVAINKGTSPFKISWSENGFVNSFNSDKNAHYKWNKDGNYVVTVMVKDAKGNSAIASIDVEVVVAPLEVTVSGPNRLNTNQQGTYIASVSGGVSPYTYTWSSSGFVSQNDSTAYYRWGSPGTYTVTVTVKDGSENTASASLDIDIVPPYDFTLTPPGMLLFAGGSVVSGYDYLFNIDVTDSTKALTSVEITSIKINGQDYTQYFSIGNSPNNRTISLNNGSGSAKIEPLDPGSLTRWISGIPLGDDDIEVTAKFGDKYITKNVTVPIKYGQTFEFNIKASKYSTGTAQQNTYHYFITYDTINLLDDNPITNVYVKDVASSEYHPTIEGVLNDPKVQDALSKLQNNPESYADSSDSEHGVTIQAWLNAIDKVMNDVGAQQKTSDRTILVKPTGDYSGEVGILADSDHKTVHPYTTSRTVNVIFSSTKQIITRDCTLNSYIHKEDDYYAYERTAEEDPRLLELVTPVKLPENIISYGDRVIVVTEPGEYARYEVSPIKDNLVLNKMSGGDQWLWDNVNKKWILQINLDQPNILPPLDKNNQDPPLSFYITYKNNGDEIRGITSSKSNIDVKTVQDGVASDEAAIWYIMASGKYINPKGSVMKKVKDSSGNLIAYAILNKFALQVIGVNTGQGMLTLTKDDLQGPFEISLPVTVEAVSQNIGSINFTIEGSDYNNVSSEHWLGGYKWDYWDNDSSKGYYKMYRTNSFTWKHAKYYSKQQDKFVYTSGYYTLNIENTGETTLVVKITYDDFDSNHNQITVTETYTLDPGHSSNYSPIYTMANDWYHNSDRTTWAGSITYEVDAKIGNVYVPIKKGADTVTFSTTS